ncbi:MAG: T9SS type A sorting domain-containing protein, partial [Flavitalea sp.]
SQVSGPLVAISNNGASIQVLHNMEEGRYTFRLIVMDNNNLSGMDSLLVIVNKKIIIADTSIIVVEKHNLSTNQSPVANAGADKAVKLSYTNRALLNATLSTDADGWIKSFVWEKISGPTSGNIEIPDQGKTFVSDLTNGEYVFRVTATDNLGAIANDDMKITVSGVITVQAVVPANGNNRPVADAGADRVVALSYTNQCLLNATMSTDTDGWINSFSWKKLSGPASGSVENMNMGKTWARNLSEGVYTFRVTVKDNAGDSAYDDIIITVNKTMKQTIANITSVNQASLTPMSSEMIQAKIMLYPNPATNAVTLQYASVANGPSMINVYDMAGKKVKTICFEKAQQEEHHSFVISDLIKGLYLVELKIGDKTRSTMKFIKS